jgi:LuxR family transcriptional regulator, maltose regulon positive regulatory protein
VTPWATRLQPSLTDGSRNRLPERVIMVGPLLETKLHVPRPRRALIARTRLSEALSRGAESGLTLVSAPAGFGKTTLLAEWLAGAPRDGRSVAWLALDQRDNDPTLFWTYLLAALNRAAPGVGTRALSLLQPPRPPIDTVLTTLLNDLDALPDDVVLVLDDYHVIDARDVQDGMTFLLEHLPPQLHLVIAGRADPALSLARLRGRGELVEIRAADLRFTADEAAAYLNGAMGLALTAPDVAALESRTEGWIAALQLAALSMQGRDDIAGFIAGFAGDDRYIVDYLAEEVIQRRPEPVRRFLLRTSILNRLSGPLCDAVTGQEGGTARLAALERANLFLVPLDDRRRWYRYHHLFADVLQVHLRDDEPDVVPELHRRASAWHERHGEPSEAIRHAMAAGDLGRAADLVELAIPATRQARQEATLRRWLEALPDELIRVRPVLSNGYAGSLLVRGEVDGVETRLRDAESGLGTPSGATVVADEDEFRRLPGAIAVHRAGLARMLGDVAGTMSHALRALDLIGEDDHVGRGAAAALLGLAHWTRGDLTAAHRWYAEGMASLEKAGYLSDVVGCAMALADIRIAQGRLREAMSTYEWGLRVATGQGPIALRGAADMHVGISERNAERNELDAAVAHLVTAGELGEHAGLPRNRYRSRVAMARLRQASGDLAGAVDLLDEAERLYTSDFFPDVAPVPAVRARVWLAQGRSADVLDWARERGLSPAGDLSYLSEFEHVTLARALLAQHAAEATGLLERLLRAAEEGTRTGSVVEILVLLALSHQARGNVPAALASLNRAVALAEPAGYVRIFVDEGPVMAPLLRAVAKQGIAPRYVRRLLTAVENSGGSTPVDQGVIEPLSTRELDVLRLLGTDLDGPDIARHLGVSLHTVRSHTKRIYTKLGVNNRRAAVRRADELGLMSRTHGR